MQPIDIMLDVQFEYGAGPGSFCKGHVLSAGACKLTAQDHEKINTRRNRTSFRQPLIRTQSVQAEFCRDGMVCPDHSAGG